MGMPHETTTDNGADEPRSVAASANTNLRKIVDLPLVDDALTIIESKLADLKTVSGADVVGAASDLQSTVAAIRRQITDAATEAVMRAPDGKLEPTGAPAITARKNRDLQPGQWDAEKGGIFIGEFDLADARGKSLGIRTRWYDTAIELGKPMTFNDTATAVAHHNEHGRGGLHLDAARYEAELFEKLKYGDARGMNVIAPLKVVKAIYALRNIGEYKRMSNGDLPGKLIAIASGTYDAHWQWSCSPLRNYPCGVRAVYFTDGLDDCYHRANFRLSGRACFAELAPRLDAFCRLIKKRVRTRAIFEFSVDDRCAD